MYAVLFDIDGTLLQTGGAGHVAFEATFREDFQLTEFPQGIPFAGRSDRAIAGEIMDRTGIGDTPENWERFVTGYEKRLPAVLAELSGLVLPGVVELLDKLEQDQQTVVGLLTGNMRFGAHTKTSAYGLAERFAFGGFGDQQKDRDQIAMEAHSAAEEFVGQNTASSLCGTMVIGDTPADVQCGRAIDAFVVAVATGSHTVEQLSKCEPDLLLENLSAADGLLAEIAAAQQRHMQPAE